MKQWALYELSPFGAHSPEIDEGLRMEGMLLASRTRGAKQREPMRDLLAGRRR